jgi:pilus assembly protein CpaE
MRAVLSRATKKPVAATPAGDRGYMAGVISARGGLGVTTLALNLGISLRESYNKETIVAEFRPGQGAISLELGYLKAEGLNRLLQRKATEISAHEIENELITHASGTRLLLASHQPRDGQYIASVTNFEAIARLLPYMARYIIVDLGPSLTPVNDKIVKLCDEVIVVVEPVPQSILQTKELIADLIESGLGEGRISLVQEQLGQNIAVIFTPAPELAYQASAHNLPIVMQQPESLTAQQFSKLAERIAQRSR